MYNKFRGQPVPQLHPDWNAVANSHIFAARNRIFMDGKGRQYGFMPSAHQLWHMADRGSAEAAIWIALPVTVQRTAVEQVAVEMPDVDVAILVTEPEDDYAMHEIRINAFTELVTGRTTTALAHIRACWSLPLATPAAGQVSET